MKSEQLHQVTDAPSSPERERERKMRGILSRQVLARQNRAFAKSAGVSENNRSAGFVPAYLDVASGVSVISRFADGRPAPVHLLDGIPEEWVATRDTAGRVASVRRGIVAGFVRDGRFYTREEAALAASH
jgi:hypothetical protein